MHWFPWRINPELPPNDFFSFHFWSFIFEYIRTKWYNMTAQTCTRHDNTTEWRDNTSSISQQALNELPFSSFGPFPSVFNGFKGQDSFTKGKKKGDVRAEEPSKTPWPHFHRSCLAPAANPLELQSFGAVTDEVFLLLNFWLGYFLDGEEGKRHSAHLLLLLSFPPLWFVICLLDASPPTPVPFWIF